jgi:catechol 2,3-dioxygenase
MTAAETTIRPRRLGHANLWVKNLQRSERFYSEVCGLTVEFTEPGLVAAFLGTGNTPHDLGMAETTGGKPRYGRDGAIQIPAGVGVNIGLNHVAWEFENEADVVGAYKRAKANGITMKRTSDHHVAHSIYMLDPDGNLIEFYCDTVKEWRKVLHGPMDLITAVWDPEAAEPFTDSRYDANPEIRVVEAAPVHPRRVTHVVFGTTDVTRMVDFYTTIGGLRKAWSAPDGSVVCLRGSVETYPYNLAICRTATPQYHHLSFELADEAALGEAEARLHQVASAALERIVDSPTKRSFFLLDPDGLRTEFYVRRRAGFPDLSQEPAELRPYLV